MKIVIANGLHEADYIIKMFQREKNEIIVINNNHETCKYLSVENKIDTHYGNATKEYDLRESNIYNADVFIALSNSDIDNYIACMLAKKVFYVNKVICRAMNPKNVNLFQRLGIDTAISSTYLLAESIQNESVFADIAKTLSVEQDMIVITEILVKPNYAMCNKLIQDLNFPKEGNISCIYRYPRVIIPRGQTEIKPNDKLVIVSSRQDQLKIINYVKREK